jgi:hypothetical protein
MMLHARNIYFLFVGLLFLMGLYEIRFGNVTNAAYYVRRHSVIHMTLSGNFMIFLSFLLLYVYFLVTKRK